MSACLKADDSEIKDLHFSHSICYYKYTINNDKKTKS